MKGGECGGAILALIGDSVACFAEPPFFRSLLQQVFREFCAACDAELRVCHRQAVFHGAGGNAQMIGDFGVRPPAACEHGDAEFGGGEVARHVRARLGVMQAPPSLAEAIGNIDPRA